MNFIDFDKDFLTIKEFAEFVGMTVDSLRHYDRKGVFMPAKHGVEFANNYRYYSPTQIITVKMIRVLAEIGVPLDIIKALAEDRTPVKLLTLLNKHKDIITDSLRFYTEVHTIINTFIGLLYDGISTTEDEIHVTDLLEKRIILGGVTDFSSSSDLLKEFMRFCYMDTNPKLNLSYPIGGYFESMEAFAHAPSQPTRFFSLDPNGYDRMEEGLYLIGCTRGYYGQTNDLHVRMAAYAKKNGLVFCGPVYNVYLFDEFSVTDPDQYLLQASALVKETRRVPARRSRHAI